MSGVGDEGGSFLDLVQSDVRRRSDADDNAVSAFDGGLQKRAGNRSQSGVLGLVFTGGTADAHVRVAGISHDGTDICEVQVDEARDLDEFGDALDALTENIVGGVERVRQSDGFVRVVFEAVVRDDYKAVYVLSEFLDALFGLIHSVFAFKAERLRDDTDRQDAHLFGGCGNDGSRTGTGTAAHACGDKDHVGALQSIGDDVFALFGGAFADLGSCAGALSSGHLFTDLDLMGGLRIDEYVFICIDGDKFNALDVRSDHSVDGISAAAADANNFDLHNTVKICCHFERHVRSSLFVHKGHTIAW